jgi:hypothetical protein
MRSLAVVLGVLALAAGGCGGDDRRAVAERWTEAVADRDFREACRLSVPVRDAPCEEVLRSGYGTAAPPRVEDVVTWVERHDDR